MHLYITCIEISIYIYYLHIVINSSLPVDEKSVLWDIGILSLYKNENIAKEN
jgi:hypothetical protein